ncbi:lytic murein transglycosylase [Citreimonas salinaria]|uniref:Lytic murein transglycosylase n=1 Tax=Citreimonas salinaria TaxID=321339 RepID=A0A1H3FM71_9RHOB|nr:lytic murein transglycosylase [Citreimonas salinaria]SDX91219.1 lytic murein transglycosylase [Citreimonas salinaria]
MGVTFIVAALAGGLVAGGAWAGPLERSERPVLRAGAETVSRASFAAMAPGTSLRPTARIRAAVLAPEVERAALVQPSGSDAGLRAWIEDFTPRARAQGIGDDTLRAAFAAVRYDPDVIRRDSNQSEFTKTLWDYLGSAVSDTRIANGRAALREHDALLRAIETRYGVPKEIVAAIWGLESAYGAFRGSDPVIGSMATLAYDGRRAAFFEEQLIAALQILQEGHTTPDRMTGSWAGAMGHTQFMPTSFRQLAVDWTGDGRRDIWGDDPADSLASTAHYLDKNGWVTGQPWGVEVRLPEGFDFAQAGRDEKRMPSEWARQGVLGVEGRPVNDYGRASVLVPAGHRGVAFLVFENFRVIERYNAADAYVIGVGHLADRLAGGAPFQGDWPEGDRALTRDERMELQQRLSAVGFDTRGVDGRIGPMTLNAVRNFQRSRGMVPDGYADPALLQKLRNL